MISHVKQLVCTGPTHTLSDVVTSNKHQEGTLCVVACINLYLHSQHDRVGTVDPRLSGPHLSSCSDYPDWDMTVLLECFVKSVCFIRVF